MIHEASWDAAASFREFRSGIGAAGLDWVTEAWADIRRDFNLAADQADGHWTALSEAKVGLATMCGPGP
jgi:hypothetical protein